MKYILPGLFVLLLTTCCFAISLDQVVKLSKQKTSDDLLIQLIQKEGLDKPVSSKDVIALKEKGVSERVIQYLVKLSHPEKHKMMRQEGNSEWISDNMRAFYTTTKDGKKIKVITNLDQNGKRLGGELPPQPEGRPQARPEQYAYDMPREIRVVVEQAPPEREEEPEPYYPQQEFVDNGIPLYGGGGYYPSFYSPYIPYCPPKFGHGNPFPNQNVPGTIAIHRPLTNPRPPAYVAKPQTGSHAGGSSRLR
jgi:hypothetical protein